MSLLVYVAILLMVFWSLSMFWTEEDKGIAIYWLLLAIFFVILGKATA